MSTGTRLAGLLLLTTSLTFPAIVHAQSTDEQAAEAPQSDDGLTGEVEDAQAEEQIEESDISLPGGGIIVTGRRNRNPERSSGQVLNVLSEADIARTGEGDIAGALSRVSGLSLVGNGRVFVRGLGDRYSLAMLNGLPLPSPEPLSRVVPLDIFPTSVVSSSIVQKTYSANFPGEFGGGVINLTTKAVPTEDFLTISIGASGDTETTFENGLTYFGSQWDTFGFDNGNRDIPSNLQAFFDSGERADSLDTDTAAGIVGQLFPTNLVTLQKNDSLPVNFSANITGGLSFELGGDTFLGVVATAGISNKWRNRSVLSEQALGDLEELAFTSNTFITDNNVLVNGLIGIGLDIGEHTIRWTNLYIRDTIKTARLANETNFVDDTDGVENVVQRTAWFERQLIDSQLVGEFEFGKLDLDLRGGFARTDREAPFNTTFAYRRIENYRGSGQDVLIANVGGTIQPQLDRPTVEFDDLQEDQYFGGIDLSYEVLDSLNVTVGYAYSDTDRRSSSRAFTPRIFCGAVCDFIPSLEGQAALVEALGLRKPGDIYNGSTLANDPVLGRAFGVDLLERAQFPVFDAALTVHGAYGQARWTPVETVTVEAGVRFEDGRQTVTLDQSIFNDPIPGAAETNIAEEYFLPAGTITWEATDDLQLRLAASKTIARPQFRELVEQSYFDPESNRRFFGNPFLRDSELTNAEARAEYYMGGNKRISLAGFYKEIKNPIESFLIFIPGELRTSFANAPSAELYGAELDLSYGIDLYSLGGSFFETKQLLILANYTFTKSSLSVSADEVVLIPGGGTDQETGLGLPQELAADQLFKDGAPLTGQSDHIANLSLSLEDTEKVQQLTVLLNYASERVTSRGQSAPDVVENPGLTLDIVGRSELKLGGQPLELSFEVRNIFGRDNFEFQESGANRIEINSFDIGTTFAVGVKASF
jgi:outer membrane receptor protein involved in Fe transport